MLSQAAFRNAQARVSRSMVELAASAVRRYGVPGSSDEQRSFAARLYPHVVQARERSYVLSTHRMQSSSPTRPAPIRPYPVDAVESAVSDVVERSRKPRVRVTYLDQVSRAERKPRVRVTSDLGARLARHAYQAGRDVVVDTADSMGEGVGWARVLTGAENCAWCVMLASRGPVYRSERAALTASGRRGTRAAGEKFHDFCDCETVLVHKGRDWEGHKQFELYEDLWSEATRGYSGNAALNALRRQLDRAQRDGLSHQELLDALRAEH